MKKILVILILFCCVGCYNDNRVRIEPVFDYKISPAKQAEYRLYVMRKLYEGYYLNQAESKK
jgi:hypothetical protein